MTLGRNRGVLHSLVAIGALLILVLSSGVAAAQSSWQNSIIGSQVGVPVTLWSCGVTGCTITTQFTADVQGSWLEAWSGSPTGNATLGNVCMNGSIDNYYGSYNGYPAIPVTMQVSVTTSYSDTSGTTWSGGIASPNYGCFTGTTTALNDEGYAYPSTTFVYPNTSGSSPVAIQCTNATCTYPNGNGVQYGWQE